MFTVPLTLHNLFLLVYSAREYRRQRPDQQPVFLSLFLFCHCYPGLFGFFSCWPNIILLSFILIAVAVISINVTAGQLASHISHLLPHKLNAANVSVTNLQIHKPETSSVAMAAAASSAAADVAALYDKGACFLKKFLISMSTSVDRLNRTQHKFNSHVEWMKSLIFFRLQADSSAPSHSVLLLLLPLSVGLQYCTFDTQTRRQCNWTLLFCVCVCVCPKT